MKTFEFTEKEQDILLRLVCAETQKQANLKKDLTELYNLRYKLK